MDPQANSSFIPKQTKKMNAPKKRPASSFPLFAVISYALFIGAMLAATMVFVYNQFTVKQLQQSVSTLDQSITNFRLSDLQSVVDFDNRIKTAKDLLDHHMSLVGALSAIEQMAVQTITIESVEFERVDKQTLRSTVSARTNEIDFLIFQRDVLRAQHSGLITNSLVSNIAYFSNSEISNQKEFTFDLIIDFSVENIKGATAQFNPVVQQGTTTDSSSLPVVVEDLDTQGDEAVTSNEAIE